MIEMKSVSKSFGAIKVLDIDKLIIDSPGIYALQGPNGSGKSTLIKSLLGVVIPDQGTILINKKNIHRRWDYRNKISYLPQEPRFPESLTVEELFSFIASLRTSGKNLSLYIELFGLESYLDQQLRTLSGGTKQKVNLCLCFGFDSDILILDEPCSGLDKQAVSTLESVLKIERKKKIILISSHQQAFIGIIADQIIKLKEGRVC